LEKRRPDEKPQKTHANQIPVQLPVLVQHGKAILRRITGASIQMKTKTLLQKALSTKLRHPKHEITSEVVELALAWARDQVSYVQVQEALTGKRLGGMTAYVALARGLREHIQNIEKK